MAKDKGDNCSAVFCKIDATDSGHCFLVAQTPAVLAFKTDWQTRLKMGRSGQFLAGSFCHNH